jgi:hypothetical protein
MPINALRCLAIAAVLAAGAAAPARAQQWSDPVRAGESVREVGLRSLGFDGEGRGLLVWRGDRAVGADDPVSPFVGVATRAPGAGAWQRRPDLDGRILFADVALYGRSRAVLTGVRQDPEGSRTRSRLIVAFGRSTGDFGRPRVIATGPAVPVTYEGPTPTMQITGLLANRAGDVTLVWQQVAPRGERGVRVSLRRAGGSFSAPRTLASGGGYEAVAANERGDRLVAFRRGTRIEARRRLAGRDWGPFERVGVTGGGGTEVRIDAALTATGKALVTWTDRAIAPGQGVILLHRAAARTRRSGWQVNQAEGGFLFTVAGPETGYVLSDPSIRAVADARGRPWIVWGGMAEGRMAVKAAPIVGADNRLRPGATTIVSATDRHVAPGHVTAAPSGELLVTWAQPEEGAGLRPMAAVRLPGGPWGAPELVAGEPPMFLHSPRGSLRGAFAGGTGTPVVAWTGRGEPPAGMAPFTAQRVP